MKVTVYFIHLLFFSCKVWTLLLRAKVHVTCVLSALVLSHAQCLEVASLGIISPRALTKEKAAITATFATKINTKVKF